MKEEKRRWRERRPPMTLMAGLGDVLPALAGVCRLGILGQYGRELVERLEEAGLTRHFSFLSTQDAFTLTKPDPRYFEQVLRSAGVQASDSIMVGDRIDKDVIPALQVGMGTIRVRTGLHRNQEPRLPEERPDAEVSRLEELPAAVARLVCAKSVPA